MDGLISSPDMVRVLEVFVANRDQSTVTGLVGSAVGASLRAVSWGIKTYNHIFRHNRSAEAPRALLPRDEWPCGLLTSLCAQRAQHAREHSEALRPLQRSLLALP